MPTKKIFVGNQSIAQVRKGSSMQFPSPVKDGLVLWYDFMGRENSDAKRGIAEDLSGNGNDGVLQNFAYLSGSGYEDARERDGENLITKTNYVEKNAYLEITKAEETFNNMPVYKGVKLSNGSPPVHNNKLTMLPGQSFTFSVYIKIEKLNDPARAMILFYDTIASTARSSSVSKDVLGWQRVSTTYTNDSGVVKEDIRPYFYLTKDTGEVTWFSSPMVTEGTEVLEYRPSRTDPLYSKWAESKGFKRGLRFDGMDDYLRTVNINDVYSRPFTLSILFKQLSYYPGGGTIIMSNKGSSFASLVSGLDLYIYPGSNTLVLRVSNDVIQKRIDGLTPILLDNKTLVDIVFSDNKIVIYINGIEDITKDESFIINATPTLPLYYFGRLTSWNQIGESEMYSARIYNRALTPEEITHNYQIEKERWGLE